tara:strand:+ start:1373 stop:1549 length:177 start_codon:yes stop_codon:yes gene_type:complete
MLETTLSKTSQGAELLAASIIINELLKDSYIVDNLTEHHEKLELLATIAMATFPPAEA